MAPIIQLSAGFVFAPRLLFLSCQRVLRNEADDLSHWHVAAAYFYEIQIRQSGANFHSLPFLNRTDGNSALLTDWHV